jgi:hypothetical protein
MSVPAHQLPNRLILARNLALERELIQVVHALDTSGIPSVVLKGIPMRRSLGLSLDTRVITDNDLLVRYVDVPRAVNALAALGYAPPRFWTVASALRVNFQYPLTRSRGRERWLLELHWSITHPKLHPLDESILWNHTEPYELNGVVVRVFDAPMLVVHLAAHFAQHYFREGRILEEFALAVGRLRATDSLEVIARSLGLRPVVSAAWHIAHARGLLHHPPIAFCTRRGAAFAKLDRRSDGSKFRQTCAISSALLLANPWRVPGFVAALAFLPPDHLASLLGYEPSGTAAWVRAYSARTMALLALRRQAQRGESVPL